MNKVKNTEINLTTNSLVDIRKVAETPIASLVIKNDDNTFNKSNCYTFLIYLIDDICAYFGSNFSANQKVELSKTMYINGYFIKELEWKLFLQRCKSMYYNDVAEVKTTLSPSILMNWFNSFSNEVLEVSANEVQLLNQKAKEDFVSIGEKERGFATIEEMSKAFNIESKKEPEIKKDADYYSRIRTEQLERFKEQYGEIKPISNE